MSADGCLGLRQRFAGPDTLVPRVTQLGVTGASTVSEPRTAGTTTTAFSRLLNVATFAAHGPAGHRRRDHWYLHMRALVKETKSKTLSSHRLVMQSHVIFLGLTFAGLHAFRPPVSNVFAAKSSAVLEPSTARSATTDSA